MTEFELFQALRPLFPQQEYALFPQVANGTGYGANRHIDAIAMGLWPSRGLHFHGFEIKSHRSDWIRELRDPKKAEDMHGNCNYWSVVAADDKIVKAEEVPHGWGFFFFHHQKARLVRQIKPAFVERSNVNREFVAALLRQAQQAITPDSALIAARNEGFTKGMLQGKESAKADLEDYGSLKKRVEAFEERTGVMINDWRPIEMTARAVKLIIDGSAERERERLLKLATHIVKELTEQQ